MFTVVINGSISNSFESEKDADVFIAAIRKLLVNEKIIKYDIEDLFDKSGVKVTTHSKLVEAYGLK